MTKNIQRPKSALSLFVFLVAFLSLQVTASGQSIEQANAALQRPEVAKYENQLVTAQTENFATFRSLPLPGRDGNPFLLFKFNDQELKNTPFLLFAGDVRDYIQASAKIKIPPGKHTITVRGGGWRELKKTTFKDFQFEPNTDYLLVYEPAGKSVNLRLYKYTTDPRFSPLDKDHFIVGEPVSAPVPLGMEIK